MKTGNVVVRVALVVLPLLLVALVPAAVHEHQQRRHTQQVTEQRCRNIRAIADQRHDEPGGIAVLGDSYAQGLTVAASRETFPVLVAARLRQPLMNDSIGGSGFVAGSPCGGMAFATRIDEVLAAGPKVLVFESGLNDLGAVDETRAGASKLLARAAGVPVVMVGPPSAPAAPPGEVDRMVKTLRSVAAKSGVPFVDISRVPLAYGSDGLHTDAAGQRMIADQVTPAVRRLLEG